MWQYAKTTGGMENNLKLVTTPMPTRKPTEHLVRVIAASLNAVDYKVAEISVIGGFAVPKPATPGMDIAGEIVGRQMVPISSLEISCSARLVALWQPWEDLPNT